ncbi:helix-turn-helix domain-containing protein [Uliginosibacterium sp. H3]|uniref:Helix-turn-helix domain-containing protein n=1 Tax=Uliginosibacterium silvisoli TaxID=3114758 RepID=A0ABU6K2W8_9RHOO|nr:helix-turn-helix domain-containing protein [Uliginosibacterium sp. H3]
MSDGQQFEPPIEETPSAHVNAWQLLRETREARGLTVAEVAQHLKLTPRQVEAMEAGDLAHLPGPAFARGFVRNYARFLHLDPAHFSQVLDVVREVPPPINTLPLGQMPGPVRWRFSALPALGIAAALLMLAVAGWYYRWFEPRDEQYLADIMSQSGALAEQSVPLASAPVAAPAQSEPSAPAVEASAAVAAPSAPVAASVPVAVVPASAPVASPALPPAAASAPRAVASSSAASAASSAAAASVVAIPAVPVVPKAASAPLAQSAALSGAVPKGSHRLHFAFAADAWVEVRDANGKVIFSRLNPAGSEQDVQGEAPLQVVIGNAPQVRLSVDGKALDLGSRTSSNVARLSLP